jgi:3-deoxy-D-manno-octulosonate 8-phosphate phosphatase (KDO 8-P phosphatase)
MLTQKKLSSLAKKIKLLILDVDGVLTDGKLYFSATGDTLKTFNAQDGLGIKMLLRSGTQVAIITGRDSEIVTQRARELGINTVYQGQIQKLTALHHCCQELMVPLKHVAYMGDDINDIPVLREVGLRLAPANAMPEVKKIAHYSSQRNGGDGAVREICDLILQAQNLLKPAQAFYGV